MFFLHGVLVFLCFLHHGFSLQNGFFSDDELVSTVGKLLYNDPFSENELQSTKSVIQSNLFTYLGILLEGHAHFKEESLLENRKRRYADESTSSVHSKIRKITADLWKVFQTGWPWPSSCQRWSAPAYRAPHVTKAKDHDPFILAPAVHALGEQQSGKMTMMTKSKESENFEELTDDEAAI
ncbi:hypothetical protein JHK85_007077 [Glycine max]|nr:hypothetical protein JHK85_007077 [Glycine max]